MPGDASETAAALQRRQQRHRRRAVRLPVRISSIDSETDPETGSPCFRISEETCGDLSRGGAFVMTSEPPRPGQRFLVELELPGDPPVQTLARVAWTRVRLPSEGQDVYTGFGLEFLGGTRRDLAAIDRFVRGASARPRRSASTARQPNPGTAAGA
jgi:hypothetical protein